MEDEFFDNGFSDSLIPSEHGEADPYIIKVNGFYYLFFTCEIGIKSFKTMDFKMFFKVKNGDNLLAEKDVKNSYAPEVHLVDGKFFLVTSPSGNGHFLFVADSIEGPYERISDNFHEMIDGTIFKDDDGKLYFLRASETGIVIREIVSLSDFKGNESLIGGYTFKYGKIGRWTEGPFIFKRLGYYYLTYCGTHFLSDAYRVDCCAGKSIAKLDSLKFSKTLLLSTDPDFYGLGHSMCFIAPDLASYYIAYHEMEKDGVRRLSLSRLLFSKNGEIYVNGAYRRGNSALERPDYEKFFGGKDFLSESGFSGDYTLEYNFSGQDCILIFDYHDGLNYKFISFCVGSLYIYAVFKGNKGLLYKKSSPCIKTLDGYHVSHVSFSRDAIDVELDGITIVDGFNVGLSNGHFGFKNNLLVPSYIAYSKKTLRNVDFDVIKKERIIFSLLSKDGDRLYDRFSVESDGEYIVTLQSKGRHQDVKFYIDDKEFAFEKTNDKIEKNKLEYLGKVSLKNGVHQFKMAHSDEVLLKNLCELAFEKTSDDADRIERIYLPKDIEKFNVYHRYELKGDSVYFENDRNAILTRDSLLNYEVSSKIELVGNPVEASDFVGLIVDIDEYGKDNSFENAFSLYGYIFAINLGHLFIYEAAYSHTKLLFKKYIHSKRKATLKIIKEYGKVMFYYDGVKVFETNTAYDIVGKVGIYNNHASGRFEDFVIVKKEDDL